MKSPILLVGFVAGLLAKELNAQGSNTIRGTVVDSATAQAISDVRVELTALNERVVAQTTTDRNGRFQVRTGTAGVYRLRLQRIAYRPLLTDQIILADKADTTLSLRMSAAPVKLESLSVSVAENPFLAGRGFYRRRLSGPGQFLGPARVDSLLRRATLVTHLLETIPGMTIVRRQGVWQPRFVRSRGCFPRVYVDGLEIRANRDEPADINSIVDPGNIMAIEAYASAAQVPLEYGGAIAGCGVVLLWTRH